MCTGVGHSVRTFAALVVQAVSEEDMSGGKSRERAELLGFGELPMRADDEPYLVGDGERMRGELGWRPQHDLAAGIRAAVAALRASQRAAV